MRDELPTDPKDGRPYPVCNRWVYARLTPRIQRLFRWERWMQRYRLINLSGDAPAPAPDRPEPERRLDLWEGPCGHHWLLAECGYCPICGAESGCEHLWESIPDTPGMRCQRCRMTLAALEAREQELLVEGPGDG